MIKKELVQINFNLNCSEVELFQMINTPIGLSSWYSDNVKIDGEIFSFFWADTEQKAKLISIEKLKHIRFRWLDEEDKNAYFEFKVETKNSETLLIITDFVEDEEDKEDTIDLYKTQVEALKILLEDNEISEIFI